MTEVGVDELAYRHVMRHFPTGVTVVTTEDEGVPHGMTANSLASVSLNPVMLLVCLLRDARTAVAVRRRGRFAVNILCDHQEELSRRFALPGVDHFDGVQLEEGPDGLPLVRDALAHVVCSVSDVVGAGDHDVVFGAVEHCHVNGGSPLVFFLGGYRRLPGPSRLG
jgi:flavin reductase (DIM6/NTAB) family NADH-FMN oxidoreductase RutF